MEIRRILVSQPVPQVAAKAPFYDIATKLGVEVHYHPFVKVEGINIRDFRSQRVEVLQFSAVIFMNRATVDSFFQLCEQSRIVLPITMKYFCLTEAIALYTQKYIQYRKRKIFFATGQFDNLAELILKHPAEKYLLTATDPCSAEIVSILQYLCVNFTKVVLAKTVNLDLSAINIEDYDLVALYSTPEIKALKAAFDDKRLPAIAAFGNRTAAAVSASGLQLVATAPTATVPSLAKAIEGLIAELKKGAQLPSLVVEESVAAEFVRARALKPIRRPRVPKVAPKVTTAQGRSQSLPKDGIAKSGAR